MDFANLQNRQSSAPRLRDPRLNDPRLRDLRPEGGRSPRGGRSRGRNPRSGKPRGRSPRGGRPGGRSLRGERVRRLCKQLLARVKPKSGNLYPGSGFKNNYISKSKCNDRLSMGPSFLQASPPAPPISMLIQRCVLICTSRICLHVCL